MKAHRYFAIIVFIVSAVWVVTGDFSSVGSAADATGGAAGAEAPAVAGQETAQASADPNRDETGASIQSVGYAVIPQIERARTVRVVGVTDADKTTRVTARANGIIGELLVRQGDRVEQGQTLARLDPEGRDAAVRSAEQLVAQRRAEAESRRALVERGTLPRLQLEEVLSALRTAESQLESARAELDRLAITAPFAGVIDTLDVEPGASVQTGAPVGTLISLDPIIGRGNVNEQDLPLVELGASATLNLVSGEAVSGTLTYISRQADPTTRTYEVEIEVPNEDYAIPSGMTAEIAISSDVVVATPVPRSIITLNDAGDLGVRAVGEDDRVVFYPIDLVDDSTQGLLLAGIPPKTRIIVLGQNLVTEGQQVKPQQADNEAMQQLLEEAQQSEVVAQ